MYVRSTMHFTLGASLVIGATFLYNTPVVPPLLGQGEYDRGHERILYCIVYCVCTLCVCVCVCVCVDGSTGLHFDLVFYELLSNLFCLQRKRRDNSLVFVVNETIVANHSFILRNTARVEQWCRRFLP